MNDRELLEAAAKAAGMRVFVWGTKGAENFTIKLPDGTPGARWNPLTDDGDALRLAVNLNLFHAYKMDSVAAMVEFDATDPDPYAATRRAIVRAAAALAGDREQS